MSSSKQKRIKLIKENELVVRKEQSIYCDFCGEQNLEVFTSSYEEKGRSCNCKCEMQICVNCIEQLSSFINPKKK